MYNRILVPLDGSAASEHGLQEALRLAKLSNASLVLLHVLESYPVLVEMATATTWQQLCDALHEQGQKLLDRAHALATSAGVASETSLQEATGRVCDVIVEQAHAHHCQLIVMGTHGRRGVQRALIGSDAERVLRASPVPVLMVRAPGRD